MVPPALLHLAVPPLAIPELEAQLRVVLAKVQQRGVVVAAKTILLGGLNQPGGNGAVPGRVGSGSVEIRR